VVLPAAGTNTTLLDQRCWKKAGDSGPSTYIKIAVPFPRATDKIFAGVAFYRRVLPVREGRAEHTRVRGRESRKIGARRMNGIGETVGEEAESRFRGV